MSKLLKFIFAASIVASISACKKEVPPEEPAPVNTTTTRTETVTTTGVDPYDYSNPDNLANPDSLLSQRVIYFDFDQSRVRPQYRDVISAHARFLAANSGWNVVLEGHADERGSREYNLGLGERRGNAVEDLMDAQGASSRQMEVRSFGEEQPVCMSSTESCWQRNRRVEIRYPND